MFALQDEPEKGHRWVALAVGVVVAVALQGGGLYAAHTFAPPEKDKKGIVSVAVIVQTPKPKPPPPPEVAPEPPPEPVAPPPPEPPKPEPPQPKPKPRPKPKPEPKPEPPKQEPQAAKAEPPKQPVKPIVLPGITEASTSVKGTGPTMQVGNTQMGNVGNTGRAPVTGPAPAGPTTVAGDGPGREPVRVAAKLDRVVKPDYTRAALRAGVEGQVVVLLTIDEAGRVVDAKLVSGLGYGLDEVALEAVRKWRYRPATLDGKPIRTTQREKVRFVLED